MGHHVSLSLHNPLPSRQLLAAPFLLSFLKHGLYSSLMYNLSPLCPAKQASDPLPWLTISPFQLFQSSTTMAALARGWGAAPLHRQHEPLRRHLHRGGRPAGPVGRRQHHRRARGGSVPSNLRLGCGWDGEREVMFVDVRENFEGGRKGRKVV